MSTCPSRKRIASLSTMCPRAIQNDSRAGLSQLIAADSKSKAHAQAALHVALTLISVFTELAMKQA